MECFKCGISGSRITFKEVITPKGIKNICERCAYSEDFPIVKPSKNIDISEPEKTSNVHERLVRLSGVDVEKRKIAQKQLEATEKQNASLRDIVDKNFAKKVSEGEVDKSKFIDNFHWVLLRARRAKKLTREQLARQISEPESAIKLAEQGIMPEDNFKLARKLEDFLRISILKKEVTKELELRKTQLGFDPSEARNLTIADLQEMKKKKQAKNPESPEEVRYQFTPWKEESDFNDKLSLENLQELEDAGKELDLNINDAFFREDDVLDKPKISKKSSSKQSKNEDLDEGDIQDLIFGRK